MQLQNVVVLLDEVEEFCLDRSNPALTMESRMLTTAMLTKLADLRGQRKVAFFIATNRLAALDAAVTRPGRFDLQLFVGTPNLAARSARFRARLASMPPGSDGATLPEAEKEAAARTFERFLADSWDEDAMYLNYMEAEQFGAAAERVLASTGQPLSAEALAVLLRNQAATMVVRGGVREEYRLSMGLSRI